MSDVGRLGHKAQPWEREDWARHREDKDTVKIAVLSYNVANRIFINICSVKVTCTLIFISLLQIITHLRKYLA